MTYKRKASAGFVLGAALAVSLLMSASPALGTTLVHTYPADGTVENTISDNGTTFRLQSWQQKVSDTSQTQHFNKTQTIQVAASDFNGDAKSKFASTFAIDEDGYTGGIALASASAEIESYHVDSEPVTRTESFTNLSAAEIDALPQTKTYTVSSGESPNATQDAVFALQSVSPNKTNTKANPLRYSGTYTYVGSEEIFVVDSYILTAEYSGDLSKGGTESVIEATYTDEEPVLEQPTDINKTPEPQVTTVTEPETTPTTNQFGLGIMVCALAALVIALGLWLYLAFGKNKTKKKGSYPEAAAQTVLPEETEIIDMTQLETTQDIGPPIQTK